MPELSRRIVWNCGVATFLFGVSMAVAQDRTGVQVKTDQAHVVVYRTGLYRDPKMIKPSVYCGREGSGVDVQRPLFSRSHFLLGSTRLRPVTRNRRWSLDARSGMTFYIRVAAVERCVFA